VRVAILLAVALLLAVKSAGASDPPSPLGPSEHWTDDQEDGPYVRGPTWREEGSAKMPPPVFEAHIDATREPAVVRWSLTLRPRIARATAASFEVARDARIWLDGKYVTQTYGARTLVVELEPGAHEVVVQGVAQTHRMHHITEGEELLSVAALDTRHLAFATPSSVEAASITAVIPVASIERSSPLTAQGTLAVHAPEAWFIEDRSDRSSLPCTPRGFTESTYRCETSRSPSTVQGGWRSLASAGVTTQPTVELRAEVRSPLRHHAILNGGPIVGVGSAIGDGFRTRLGYEMGFLGRRDIVKRHLLTSVAVDTDFTRNVVAAVTAKGVTTLGLFGLGIGLPVRLAPEVATGVRLEGDFFVGPLGFVLSGDVWLAAPGKTKGTVTLLVAISF
jgi:hypothetical protein